jgi:hypothetical protein
MQPIPKTSTPVTWTKPILVQQQLLHIAIRIYKKLIILGIAAYTASHAFGIILWRVSLQQRVNEAAKLLVSTLLSKVECIYWYNYKFTCMHDLPFLREHVIFDPQIILTPSPITMKF